jgi:hypothetical protein
MSCSEDQRCMWQPGDTRSHACYHNTHGRCPRKGEDCACNCHP